MPVISNPPYRNALIAGALAVLSMPASLSAAVNPGESIQAAIDAALPGDIVRVAAGAFTENITLRDGISLQGAGAGETILSGSITIPADVQNALTLSDLTGAALSVLGHNVSIQGAAFTGTASFEGDASADVSDTTFSYYVVGQDSATVTFSGVTVETNAFTWDNADVTYDNSTLNTYLELRQTSRTTIRNSTWSGAYLYDSAYTALDNVDTLPYSTLSLQGQADADITSSTLATLLFNEEASATIADSTVSLTQLTVAPGESIETVDFGPGLLSHASASSTSGPFALQMTNTTLDEVRLDVSGSLTQIGGGFNGYSYVRDGGIYVLDGGTTQGLLRLLGTGQADLINAQVAGDLEIWESSEVILDGSDWTSGTATIQDNAHLIAQNNALHGQVDLRGAGSLVVDGSTISHLVLEVDEGESASIQGLHPGLGDGLVAEPGTSLSGPSIELFAATLDSIQLRVRGIADVVQSTFDDYGIVESNGAATFTDTTFETFALFQGQANVDCLRCDVNQWLIVTDDAVLAMTDGTLSNYAELKGASQTQMNAVTLNAPVYLSGTADALLSGSSSTTTTIRAQETSTLHIEGGSDLYALTITDTASAQVSDSRITIVTFEVPAGQSLSASGLHPGLLDGNFGDAALGPALVASAADVTQVALLNHGQANLSDSTLNGFTYSYGGAHSGFYNCQLDGITYILDGSTNIIDHSSITQLLNVGGGSNQFLDTRFAAGASFFIGGSSDNTFTRCVFETGLTLSDQSINDFGNLFGTNAGENDFSMAAGYFKLSNATPNDVYAQNCLWGSDDPIAIADMILDQEDDPAHGLVIYDPFLIANHPPEVFAGDDLQILSSEQDATVIEGSAFDPDGDPLTYRWYEGETLLLDDTLVDPDTGAADLDLALVPFMAEGEHILTLEVTELDGVSVRDEVILSIGNAAPVPSPTGGGTLTEYDLLTVGGEVADYDGDIVTWTWWLGDDMIATGAVETVIEGTPVLLPDITLDEPLSIGTHTLTLVAEDGVNAPVSESITVEVVDTTAPVMSPVAEPSILWPPDGTMRDVLITTYAMDASGGAVTLEAKVTSNQPGWRNWGEPDWTEPVIDQEAGTISLQLRAERNPRRRGRVYVVWIRATDEAGNSSTSRVKIRVPRWGWWHQRW